MRLVACSQETPNMHNVNSVQELVDHLVRVWLRAWLRVC
jgi:hypothetical protein